jgi:molecular chaperone DnaK
MQQFSNIGLDHGTCNSSVAIMTEEGPVVMTAPGEARGANVMPSFVYIDKRGIETVGTKARQLAMSTEKNEGNGYTGYKPRIGSDDRFAFDAAKVVYTAPELGAKVIAQLLKACRSSGGGMPTSAVITVPAKFLNPQYDGTRKAAMAAGLKHCELLQEPVAAALAYGFSTEQQDAKWIVFDLGGGTLDVTLVVVSDDGNLDVPREGGHAGNPDLGGRIFDEKLVDYVLGPNKADKGAWERCRCLDPNYKPLRSIYALECFAESNNPVEWGLLMLAVEDAKIKLSESEAASVELEEPLCMDERRRPVKVNVKITRSIYERLIEPDIKRAVNCCRALLSKNKLQGNDISRIILVGGPTKTPYIQEQLRNRLGIELECSKDPMTAVAQGAALYASTVEVPEELQFDSKPDTGEIVVEIACSGQSEVADCPVSGQVRGNANNLEALRVVFEREDGGFAETIAVDSDGFFEGDILLQQGNRPTLSKFVHRVEDSAGNILFDSTGPMVWHPFPNTGAVRLPNSLLIHTSKNSTFQFMPSGEALPNRVYHTFRSDREINKKTNLKIEVLESMENHLHEEIAAADCNARIGELVITYDDVGADLPAGSELEVALDVDASQVKTLIVDIPLLDRDFERTFVTEEEDLDIDGLQSRYKDLHDQLEEARRLHEHHAESKVTEALKIIDEEETLDAIERSLKHGAKGNQEARRRAYKDLLRLAGTLYTIRRCQQSIRIRATLDSVSTLVTDDDKKKLRQLQLALESTPPDLKSELDELEENVNDLRDDVRFYPIHKLDDLTDAPVWDKKENGAKYLDNFTEQHIKLWEEAIELEKRLCRKGDPHADKISYDLLRRLARKGVITDSDLIEVKVLNEKLLALPDYSILYSEFLRSRVNKVGGRTQTARPQV